MFRRPPKSTRTDTLFPYTTLFRSRYPTLPQAKALLQDEHLRPLFQYIERLPAEPRPNTPLGKIFALHQQFIKPAVGAPAVLQDAVNPKLPPRLNTERLAEAFKPKQWTAKALLDTHYRSAERRIGKECVSKCKSGLSPDQ